MSADSANSSSSGVTAATGIIAAGIAGSSPDPDCDACDCEAPLHPASSTSRASFDRHSTGRRGWVIAGSGLSGNRSQTVATRASDHKHGGEGTSAAVQHENAGTGPASSILPMWLGSVARPLTQCGQAVVAGALEHGFLRLVEVAIHARAP